MFCSRKRWPIFVRSCCCCHSLREMPHSFGRNMIFQLCRTHWTHFSCRNNFRIVFHFFGVFLVLVLFYHFVFFSLELEQHLHLLLPQTCFLCALQFTFASSFSQNASGMALGQKRTKQNEILCVDVYSHKIIFFSSRECQSEMDSMQSWFIDLRVPALEFIEMKTKQNGYGLGSGTSCEPNGLFIKKMTSAGWLRGRLTDILPNFCRLIFFALIIYSNCMSTSLKLLVQTTTEHVAFEWTWSSPRLDWSNANEMQTKTSRGTRQMWGSHRIAWWRRWHGILFPEIVCFTSGGCGWRRTYSK